jgi:aminoglycoside phosphotransferase (APT) family kinase protein
LPGGRWPLQNSAHPRNAPPAADSVRQYLSGIFGGTAAIDVERVPEGVSTYVYRVARAHERCYLRVLPELDDTFAPEVRVHQLALAAGARVPEVLHYEPLSEQLGGSVMLTTEIPGWSLCARTPANVAENVVMAAGRDLAWINAIPVKGFDWVRRDMQDVPERLTAEQPTARDFLLTDLTARFAVLPAAGFTADEVDRLTAIVRTGERWLDDDHAHLSHGDFDTSHIYADVSGYRGIIDFGEMRGAPQLYDLAHHRMHDSEWLPFDTLPYLIEGYESITPLPVDYWEQLCYLSLLIALRSLARGLARSATSQIVRISVAAIRRDAAQLSRSA